MKSILFILTISFAGTYSAAYAPPIKSMSVAADEYENIFNIKMTAENNIKNCAEEFDKEFLNLSGMFLKNIQSDIIRSDAIRYISLHDNFLKKIPHTVLNHVTHLSCFNLSHNHLNLYVENSIQHPHLRVLDLSHQKKFDVNAISKLEVFEEEAENMYTHMTFNSTKMRLPNIEYLDLSGNDMSTLLRDFNVSFPKLVRLDLIGIDAQVLDPNFFDVIPTSLRFVHLENNHLRNLTLRNIREITALYLDGNPFEELNITSTKLRILSLSNCMNLNTVFLDMPYLEELDLSKSNLDKAIRVTFDMFRSLRILLLDYNKLLQVPILNNMQWLNELSLRYNMIEYIQPNRFEYLVSLKKLSLKGNRINRLEMTTFKGLENLQYLDLSENKFNYLPSDWAFPLTKLQYLNLNSNHFAGISDMGIYALTSLSHLFVKNNTFSKITTMEIEPLPNYVTVYLV